MTENDYSDQSGAAISLPAILDELDSSAPMVKRLKKAGPEVVAMLDTILEEARVPPVSVEWIDEDETAKEILGVIKKVNVDPSTKNRHFAVEKIGRLINESG